MNNKKLINEILEHLKEELYPGSSFNCGVYAILIDKNFVYFYYPKKNALMKTNRKTHENFLLGDDFYTEKMALAFIKK